MIRIDLYRSRSIDLLVILDNHLRFQSDYDKYIPNNLFLQLHKLLNAIRVNHSLGFNTEITPVFNFHIYR